MPVFALLPTVAGTASSHPHALWQSVAQAWAAQQPGQPCPLAHWTADAAMAAFTPALPSLPALSSLPAGSVFWLPTPASASAGERAQEQACRQQLMHAMATGHLTSLRVLYGTQTQQCAALLECLQQPAIAPDPTAPLDATQHAHTNGLRCRECLDPASEQRLFSRLLGQNARSGSGS